jgi:hypothetical protein
MSDVAVRAARRATVAAISPTAVITDAIASQRRLQ